MSRFMMQALGAVRPLSFDGGGSTAPLMVSATSGWSGIPFEMHRTRPFVAERDSGPASGQQTLIITVEGSTQLVFREREHEVSYRSGPGSLSFHTSEDRPTLKRVTGTAKLVALRLTPDWRERILEHGAPIRLGFLPPLAPDETLCDLALAMCREVADGASSGPLFAESLSLALLTYALDRLPTSRMRVRGALSEGHQRRLRRYIEERLQQDVTVHELASLCGLRARQFSTLFRRAFGTSPYRYVIDRRLARGAELLRAADRDVAEISELVGFCSPSHFATEFRRNYGVSPRQYLRARRCLAS